jgi:hypothetical protein
MCFYVRFHYIAAHETQIVENIVCMSKCVHMHFFLIFLFLFFSLYISLIAFVLLFAFSGAFFCIHSMY